jgi:flagellar hook-basal body protein
VETTVAAAEARERAAAARLEDYTVRAPFDGRVGLRQVSLGAFVDTKIAITTLDDVGRIRLDFSVPEPLLSRVRIGAQINAQSVAFGNISDNVANSQTIGFKRIDTSFIDFLTSSSAMMNSPGSVQARPDYRNSVQGTIAQSQNPLAMGIVGQGFFEVSRAESTEEGEAVFSPQRFVTRAGDFQMNRDGFLVNSADDYLNGWSVDPATGVVDRSAVAPIQVTQTVYNPIPTSSVTLSANLPATPATTGCTWVRPTSEKLAMKITKARRKFASGPAATIAARRATDWCGKESLRSATGMTSSA